MTETTARFAGLAEPTRLRLLLVCRDQELAVGQLAAALRLPEPAISRHLATLARVGLLERLPLGREVRYRWSAYARAAPWLTAALAPLAESDAGVHRDRARLTRIQKESKVAPFVADSLFGQRLADALRLLANNTAGARALAMHVSQGPVLDWLSAAASELAVLAPPDAVRQSIAAFARERGISFRWVAEQKAAADFDLVCVTATSAESMQQRLTDAQVCLAPQGRILLGLPYDALEQTTGNGAPHPLFRLRAMLTSQGFGCERLLPLEAAGEHWLLACGPLMVDTGAIARQG